MPKKKNEMQVIEELKKKTAEEIHKKLPTLKAKQDAINENLQRLQEFRDAEANPYGKGKQKNMAAVTAVYRACDSQQVFGRNLLEEIHRAHEADYRAQMTGEISRRDLMELIKIRGHLLPLWIGYDSPFPCENVGAIAPAENSKLNEHDSVAAFNKDGNWILADIVTCHSNSRYECRDVDDDKKKLTVFARSHLIPLPKWKANPASDRHALFEKNAIVLALYPQTTCFYKGIVHSAPADFREPYQVMFEDSSYNSGFCPPMPVSQKYIVAFREVAGHTASTAPKKGNNHKKK
uniref:SGF29 C-terminal domain-containing protein n=1 Tax=Caenorhabditis japonica TaxID=281687 RepID=A0A8R1HWW7_CAEJA